MWQKVRSLWSYVYDHFYDDFDWFHIGGDDYFLIVENLRLYLASDEIRLAEAAADGMRPLFLGRRFARDGNMKQQFHSGGSGYTLNKAALKLLVLQGFPNFFVHEKIFMEDVKVAETFQRLNVYPYDTKDENGGERYMPLSPGSHLTYRMPKPGTRGYWISRYSIDIKEGLEHCSPYSISFHYIRGEEMLRIYALLYGVCPSDDGA
jgi:glycoprotein-N-acetylgalactosamine 3-beta-galactosyltransferase